MGHVGCQHALHGAFDLGCWGLGAEVHESSPGCHARIVGIHRIVFQRFSSSFPSSSVYTHTLLTTMLSVALVSFLGLAASTIEAHKGCGGGEIMRRNPGGPLVSRDDTTWQSEAALGK